MSADVHLLVGTRKGGFILDGDPSREAWRTRGPFAEGWSIYDVTYDPRTGSLLAGGYSPWYGPAVWRSTDLGATWSQSSEGLTYGDQEPAIRTVWTIATVHGVLYAGVEPAGLFRSVDGGVTWTHVRGLRDHPTRPDWEPGNGGLCLHSVVAHPEDPARLWVGISAVGTFRTVDGGETWTTQNRGVQASHLPDPYPEIGQCVHKLRLAPGHPDWLYQQNHSGVYRSRDAGETWESISEGLPSRFGFPMAVHPRDPETVYVFPLDADDQTRTAPGGRALVWRTHDGGRSWVPPDGGLPTEHAHLSALREAMAADDLAPAGIYVGTSTGQLFASRDEGRTWSTAADFLPPIYAVDALVLG